MCTRDPHRQLSNSVTVNPPDAEKAIDATLAGDRALPTTSSIPPPRHQVFLPRQQEAIGALRTPAFGSDLVVSDAPMAGYRALKLQPSTFNGSNRKQSAGLALRRSSQLTCSQMLRWSLMTTPQTGSGRPRRRSGVVSRPLDGHQEAICPDGTPSSGSASDSC